MLDRDLLCHLLQLAPRPFFGIDQAVQILVHAAVLQQRFVDDNAHPGFRCPHPVQPVYITTDGAELRIARHPPAVTGVYTADFVPRRNVSGCSKTKCLLRLDMNDVRHFAAGHDLRPQMVDGGQITRHDLDGALFVLLDLVDLRPEGFFVLGNGIFFRAHQPRTHDREGIILHIGLIDRAPAVVRVAARGRGRIAFCTVCVGAATLRFVPSTATGGFCIGGTVIFCCSRDDDGGGILRHRRRTAAGHDRSSFR